MALTDPGDSAQQAGGRAGAEDVEGCLNIYVDVWLVTVQATWALLQLCVGIAKQDTRHTDRIRIMI